MTNGIRRGEIIGLCALVAAIFVLSVATFLQQGEDSFISFRYVQQAAAGHGLVFNVGERVEGYSNLLWVLLLVPFAWLGMPLGPCSQLIATASFATLAVVAYLTARRLLHGMQSAPGWLAWWLAGAVALDPLLHYHDDRGLETVTYSAAISAALLVLGSGGLPWLAGLLAGAAVLLRPEGILFAMALVPAVAALRDPFARRREETRRIAIHLAIYMAIPLGLFAAQMLFRVLYYGEWVPNTVLAKRHSGVDGHWQLISYALTRAGVPLLSILGFALALRSPRFRALGIGGLCLYAAAALFQLRAGGLLNEGFRYLAPIFPLSAIGCWLLITQLVELARGAAARLTRLAAALVLILQPVLLFAAPPPGGRWLLQGNGNAPRSRLLSRLVEAQTWNLPDRLRWYLADPVFINADAGRFMAAQSQPGTLMAADQMGQFGYFVGMDRPVIDLLGLMDREVARHGLRMDYLLGRKPTMVVVEACLDTDYWPATWRGKAHVASLRDTLNDDRFQAEYRPRWMLPPRYTNAQLGYLVYIRRDSADQQPFEQVPVGADEATIRHVWRVF
ncbi:hypothetical protein GC173_13635 [bacterium]|nr:hypothetical protein [bacterium]